MKQMIAFCIRPEDKKDLKKVTSRVGTSEAVRSWITDYLADQKPLTKESENLVQVNLTIEKAKATALKEAAQAQGLSMMALTRLIVEDRLQKIQAGAGDEIKKAIREVLLEQQNQ